MLRLHDCLPVETLHQGADTIVRLIKHVPTDDSFVIKMSIPMAHHPRAIGRLIHEHQLLVKLADVPGVVRARGFAHEGGQAALWLEYRSLCSLDRILAKRGRLPLHTALRVALDLSRVLEGIHAKGVVHKDVKPQNMLWDEVQERVTLIDFAIASELSEEATNAAAPEALEGTLAYMSPEQTGRTARGLDARTDIYSLGVVLFELLAGRRPFVETDPLSLIHAHLAKPVPPLEGLVPGFPPAVARIVERCLEKHPEKRYQTVNGLSADLAECLRRLEATETMDGFVLGRKDFSPVLHIPQAMFGRENESARVRAAFERVAGGAVEVLLVGGPSGIGKTALIRSVYQVIAKADRGLLLWGKHDQLGRSVPYAALAQAFGSLIRDLAASPKPVFDTWKNRLKEALGPLARVIADFVPELEWLMGTLPPAPVVTTEMTHNRLKMSWIQFVRAVADASPPLVLFLDDVQWADSASMELLEVLLTDVGKKNLLVIAAYRDDEGDGSHSLRSLHEAIRKAGIRSSRLTLGPLDDASVHQWLGAALACEPNRVAPLAAALARKTHGNPFFLEQLLLELHRQKRVRRNLDTGEWEWDQNAVELATVTGNVVELMRQKVVELPADTQFLLGHAACAGHSFSLAELAMLAGLDQTRVARDLRPALRVGLVIPQDGQYREAQALAETAQVADIDATYRFLHDRVQQACYERVDPAERGRRHAVIGRRMRHAFETAGGSNQKLLDLVWHLNLGAETLTSDDERRSLARLNLQAAKAAKANGSYRLQASLVEQAQALLGDRAWQDEPAISVELALERMEADFMLREFDEVHRRAEAFLELPFPSVPRLVAHDLRVRSCLASGQYARGEALGLEALASQGVAYPETNDECIAEALRLMGECDAWLDRHPEGFSTMPADPSIEHLLCAALDASMLLCAAIGSRPALSALVIASNVARAISRAALTQVTPFFIVALAQARSAFSGDYRGGTRWARQGERAASRIGCPLLAECTHLRGLYEIYELPAADVVGFHREARRIAMAVGSFQGVSWGLLGEVCYTNMWRGVPLEQLVATERAERDLMVRAGDAVGQHHFAVVASYAEFLREAKPVRPDGSYDGLATSSRTFVALGDHLVAELARVQEAHLFCAFGQYARGLKMAEEAEQFRPTLFGNAPVTDIPLWRGLAAAKCWSLTESEAERTLLFEKLEHDILRFQTLSQGCKENFLHKLLLLEAERARIECDVSLAEAKYDEAIDVARKEGFLHVAALAAQFCAEFYLERGRMRNAITYLIEARNAYLAWGAHALVAHLETKYPDLPTTKPVMAPLFGTTNTITEAAGDTAFDVRTAVRAAQALAGELDPDRVVGRLMELCLANAGAERGALVFVEGDSIVLVARLSVRDSHIETGLSIPLTQCVDVATTVIRYVARSRQSVLANHVLSEQRYANDPYIVQHAVRSLLALPLMHCGRLGGVLYLEHRTATSAFTPSRVELLSVIASQAAIAVENANLYRNVETQLQALETRNREVQRLNDELRRQIAQRSRRLVETLLPIEGTTALVGGHGPGHLIGDCYRVIRCVGEGAMGAVYEVERTTDGMHLAAKVLNHCPDRAGIARFAREAHILAKLSHPNLISIHDVDMTDDGLLYIVMEFVEGTTLREFSVDKSDLAGIFGILVQVAKALGALHAMSIVHRDLKPENILVVVPRRNAVPVVKLADFGISIMHDDLRPQLHAGAFDQTIQDGTLSRSESSVRGALLTEAGVIVGTPLYMAPELCEGSRNAHAPSDVFSFGVIAFELLTGTRPFTVPPVFGGSIDQDAGGKLREHSSLPIDVVGLLERCLDLDPQMRPTSKELVMALDMTCHDKIVC